jgi:hypothetical protein
MGHEDPKGTKILGPFSICENHFWIEDLVVPGKFVIFVISWPAGDQRDLR